MIAGGVTVVEVTMTSPALSRSSQKNLKEEYRIEASPWLRSTVTTRPNSARQPSMQARSFVVSPSLHPEVIATTKANHKISCPGALTPTEAITAWNAGADLRENLSLLGRRPEPLTSSLLLATFPHLKLIPTRRCHA